MVNIDSPHLLYLKRLGIGLLVGTVLFCSTPGGTTPEAFKHGGNILVLAAMWVTPGLIADLLRARYYWSERRLRTAGVLTLGGAIGLGFLGWDTFGGGAACRLPSWMQEMRVPLHLSLLPLEDYDRLIGRLNLLDSTSQFLDAMPQLFAIGAMTGLLVMYIFDKMRERWLLRSFSIGFCLAAVPSFAALISFAIKSAGAGVLPCLIPIAFLCMIPGVICILFSCTVRAGCWEPYFPWLS